MFGLNDLMNPFDDPKKTSMSTIASNVFLLLCCTMIATSIWSNPFKFRIPPLFMSLVVACLCVSLAGKNLNDERKARFAIEAEGAMAKAMVMVMTPNKLEKIVRSIQIHTK